MQNNFCVYKHTCPNGKVYIGITCQNPIKRWKGGSGYKNNKHFYSAILKYGWKNIKHEILYENLSCEEAKEKEIFLINQYKSNNREFGYNNTSGGDGVVGYKHTDEDKEKMRCSKRKNQHIVLQIDIETGQVIASYCNLAIAERMTNINHVSINYCCLGKRKTAGGYRWQYADEPHDYDKSYTKMLNEKRLRKLSKSKNDKYENV